MREKLSKKTKSKELYTSYKQRKASFLKLVSKNNYSYDFLAIEYLYNNEIIAYHLFRGAATSKKPSISFNIKNKIPKEWRDSRDEYGQFFYNALNYSPYAAKTRIAKF